MKPIIGITAGTILSNSQILRVCLIEKYCQAIVATGGLPVIIPANINAVDIPNLIKQFNGIMLTGGGDISVDKFAGLPHSAISDVQLSRDEMELELARISAESKIPLLGICRGHQVMNVALGGDLYTHIPDQYPNALKHDWFPNVARDYLAHSVIIEGTSRLANYLFGREIKVNSLHHQGIKTPASQLSAVAHASDGMIEAIELPHHPFYLGVQWHPEWLLSSPSMVNLFRSFVLAAQNADGHV